MGKDSASKQVELLSVGLGVGVEKATTTVIASAACALGMDDIGCRTRFFEIRPNFAAFRGMKGILIGRLIVDAFQDVDFPCRKKNDEHTI